MIRREFLLQNLRLAALGLVPAGMLPACTNPLPPQVGQGALIAPSHCLAADGKSTIFSFYDLDRDVVREMPVPLETGHTGVSSPTSPKFVFVPESAGGRACVIDVVEMKVVKELRASPGRWFGGHAEFAAGGRILYVSEFEIPPSGKGFLRVLDGLTFENLRSFPTGGRFPHDVAVSSDGRHLCVANLGAEKGPHVKHSGIFVSRFELPAEKLIDRVELDDDPAIMNGIPLNDGGSGISKSDLDVKADAHYFISYMKVARPHFEIFIYPHSHKPIVDIWSVKEKRLLREIAFDEQPVALTLMRERNRIAVALTSGRLQFIDVHTRQLDPAIRASKPFKVTTHLSQWVGGPADNS